MHRASAALDEIESAIEGIRTVDGHVERRLLVERCQRDAEALRLLLGTYRGGHSDDVFELAARELLAEALDGKVGRRARPEAHRHPRPDVHVDGAIAHLSLEGVGC